MHILGYAALLFWPLLFTVQCYTERGIAIASRLSVSWSVTQVGILRKQWLISFSLQTPWIYSEGNIPKFWPVQRVGYGKSGFRHTKALKSLKWGKWGPIGSSICAFIWCPYQWPWLTLNGHYVLLRLN